MFIPKVKFSIIPVKLEVDLIYFFLFREKWGLGKKIIKKHPYLENVLNIKTKKNREEHLKKYILKFRAENKEIIRNQVEKYSKDWKKIEKKYLTILPEILNTSWPKDKKIIKALISINPICPRFINNWSFSLFYKQGVNKMKETIMHEICHFLYFKKWKEVFPNAKRKTFEYPYIEWHLSEILASVILNDSRIQKLLKKKAVFYKEYQNLTIEGEKTPKHFELLYKKCIDKQYNFSIFLKKAYLEIKKNKNVFKNL